MNKFKLLSSLLLILGFTCFNSSCGQNGGSDYLSVSIGNGTTYLIPGQAYSCTSIREDDPEAEPDISSKYFTLRNLRFTWKNDSSDLYISYVQIKFISPLLSGGALTCVIAAEELYSLYWSNPINSATSWKGKILKGAETILEMDCDYKCGGIKMSQLGSVAGTIRVVGFSRDGEGNEEPVEATASMTLENRIAD